MNRSIPCYTSFLSIQRAWHWKRNIGTWLRFVRRATRTTITCDIYEVFEQLKRYRRSRHGRMPFSCNSTMVFPTRNCCRRARCFTKGRGRGKKKRKARGVRALPGNRGRQETHCWVVSAIECEPRATNRRRIGGRDDATNDLRGRWASVLSTDDGRKRYLKLNGVDAREVGGSLAHGATGALSSRCL